MNSSKQPLSEQELQRQNRNRKRRREAKRKPDEVSLLLLRWKRG